MATERFTDSLEPDPIANELSWMPTGIEEGAIDKSDSTVEIKQKANCIQIQNKNVIQEIFGIMGLIGDSK